MVSAGKQSWEMEASSDRSRSRPVNYFSADFAIRLLLFSSSIVGIVVLATGKQTTMVPIPMAPFLNSRTAQFDHAAGLIYMFSALVAAAGYSFVTMITSATAVRKPSPSTKLLLNLLILDTIMAGVMAAATGAGGGVAFIGLKGNSYVRWNKICGVYEKFCRHVGSSVGFSLLSSIALILLVILSAVSLHRRAH
ncbi:CASP-like protein 1D1 [Wolffia australiana]